MARDAYGCEGGWFNGFIRVLGLMFVGESLLSACECIRAPLHVFVHMCASGKSTEFNET